MNKVTTAALAGLMVVTAGAQASDARWNGFGSANAYIADVQDIFTLPGVVASHADTTYFELGSLDTTVSPFFGNSGNNVSIANNAWGGVHSKLAGGVLGLWFNRATTTLNGIDAGYTVPDGGVAPGPAGALAARLGSTLHNQIDVLYGYSLSDATTLGLGLSRGTNGTKTETTVGGTTGSTEETNGDFGVNLGVEQKEVGPIALLEVGLQYNSRGAAYTDKAPGGTNKIEANGSRINVRVGGDIAGEKGAFGRVELGFNTSSLNIKDAFNGGNPSNAFVESKNSGMGYNLGYAAGMSSDKGMGLCGLMLQGQSISRDEAYNGTEVNKTDKSKLNLLATTAGEAKLTNWLTFRAGLESDLFYSTSTVTETGASGATTKVTTTNDAHAGTAADPNAKASMGVSLSLGDLTLDGVFNQGLLYTGPYFISGLPAAYSSQVSLTWPWGGSKN